MRFNDIKFENLTVSPGGVRAKLDYGTYQLSVIRNHMSYGGPKGLYEIGVFKNRRMVELPGITNEDDTVKGHLDKNAVEGIMLKMTVISGRDPVLVEV